MQIDRGIRFSRNVRGAQQRILSRISHGVSSLSSRCLSILMLLDRDLGITHAHLTYRISRPRECLVKIMSELCRAHTLFIYCTFLKNNPKRAKCRAFRFFKMIQRKEKFASLQDRFNFFVSDSTSACAIMFFQIPLFLIYSNFFPLQNARRICNQVMQDLFAHLRVCSRSDFTFER